MSYAEHRITNATRANKVAKKTGEMLRYKKLALIDIITFNAGTIRPFHKNFPIMTTLLKMEAM